MITKEQLQEWEQSGIPEDRILRDDHDHSCIWAKYIKEDDEAICGIGTRDPREINYYNAILAQQSGIESNLPRYGALVDIGAGYNALQSLVPIGVKYLPCDLIEHTPLTIKINGNLPFEDNDIDTVASCNVFQHITFNQRRQYIKESHRILKPNARLFIAAIMDTYVFQPSSFNYNNCYYVMTGDFMNAIPTQKELVSWLDIGFSILSITMRYDGFCGVWMHKR